MMKLKCLVVDDEPLARKGLSEYIDEIDFLFLVAQCENSTRAAQVISQEKVDLIFLDIHMPDMSGIDFLKTLKDPPSIIFTTAFPEYALQGYALDVIDYLLKPIRYVRFLKASQKALSFHELKNRSSGQCKLEPDYFFIKCNSKHEKVFYADVQYVEALQNYAVIHTIDKKLITYITLTSLEHQLPKDQFMKVHKSFLVSIPGIIGIEGNEIIMKTFRIPISRNLKEEVLNRILGGNLLKR